jgi:hypothetical protein
MECTLDGLACAVDVHGSGLTASGGIVTGNYSYLYKASGLATNYRLVNSGSVALLLNRSVATALAGNESPALASDLTPAIANEALIFIQAVAYDVGYKLTLNGATLSEYRTPKATDTVNTLSTATVATELASRINAVSGFTAEAFGSLVYFKRTDSANFTASLDDSRSNTLARVLKDQVTSFSSLPAISRSGFTIKIASDPSSNLDDYWVQFATTDGGTYGDGFWKEVAAPQIQFKFQADTLPLVIYRAAAGVLFIGPADGASRSITVGPNTYEYTFPLWGQRTAGDVAQGRIGSSLVVAEPRGADAGGHVGRDLLADRYAVGQEGVRIGVAAAQRRDVVPDAGDPRVCDGARAGQGQGQCGGRASRKRAEAHERILSMVGM